MKTIKEELLDSEIKESTITGITKFTGGVLVILLVPIILSIIWKESEPYYLKLLLSDIIFIILMKVFSAAGERVDRKNHYKDINKKIKDSN